ncbi:hypothetical protein PWT90_02924 [Aphanocladium album]|nr:hypothetical protein PWT90_02924 [Aphanocladium album]
MKTSGLLLSLLQVIQDSVVPVTEKAIQFGNPLFGAAVLARDSLRPLTIATNNGTVSPLLHGELNCIQQFFTVSFPKAKCRPNPANDTIFLATHEPCSLCLSAIAWAGFQDFYYLFTHQESRDLFGFGGDIDILEQVFRVPGHETAAQVQERDLYNRDNKYFSGKSIASLIDRVEDPSEKANLLAKMSEVKQVYNALHQEWLNVTAHKH